MRKLLIADCSEDYRIALAAALQDQYQVLHCRTGTEARDLLYKEHPDIFVLDLMLPELDGLTLLERIYADGIRPVVLPVTSLLTPYVSGCTQRMNIEYIIRKPCEIDAVAARIKDLSLRLKAPQPKRDPVTFVSEILLCLGFSTKHNGYNYLREAILLMAKDSTQSVTKVLYPAVGHVCGCQKENVERSIRTALGYAWGRGDRVLWSRLFPDSDQRPSNAVFISRIAEALLLEE